MVVWHSGSTLITISVGPMSGPASTGMGDRLWVISHLNQLGLAIPSWVGKMSTGDGYDHCWGRNGEFCIMVGF